MCSDDDKMSYQIMTKRFVWSNLAKLFYKNYLITNNVGDTLKQTGLICNEGKKFKIWKERKYNDEN